MQYDVTSNTFGIINTCYRVAIYSYVLDGNMRSVRCSESVYNLLFSVEGRFQCHYSILVTPGRVVSRIDWLIDWLTDDCWLRFQRELDSRSLDGRRATPSPPRVTPVIPPRRPSSFKSSTKPPRPVPVPAPPPPPPPPPPAQPAAPLTYVVDEAAGQNTVRASFEPPVSSVSVIHRHVTPSQAILSPF